MTAVSGTRLNTIRRGLLTPKSLAIIGASTDPDKTTGRPLAYLRSAGWSGSIYPINSHHETIQGERAWPALEALPEVPDHALILVPTTGVRDAVASCAKAGVRVATVLASGFSEAGVAGSEAELVKIAQQGGMCLLGPSSLGFADPRSGLILTANAAFAEPGLRGGRLFAASHSGSMIGALVSRGAAKGIGFAGLVSVGSEADLSLGEICEAALEDPAVDGFLLFLESLRHAETLRRFALAASEMGKPVVAYKLGRSAQAAELAQSHTGALAGEDLVADAFFTACGIARVDTLDGLLEAPALVRRLIAAPPRRARPIVGVVATTGGGAAMVVDQLGVRGVEVRGPEPETFARLQTAKVPAQLGRVVDLTLAGTQYDVMKAALSVMTTAPEFDLVVAVAGSSSRFYPQRAVQPILDTGDSATPVAVFATPEAPDALVRLAASSIPAFRTPESCADVIAAALKRRPAKKWLPSGAHKPGRGRFIDEAAAYQRLQAKGIPVSRYVVQAIGNAAEPAIAFPVAVKILSAAFPHKTEVGGVFLDIADAATLAAATRRIVENIRRFDPTERVTRILVQEMAVGVGEVLIGFRRDADVGPVVLVSAGGILAELAASRSLRLAPVTKSEAEEMIAEVGALRALSGYRNRAAGDLDALAEAIVALSQFALDTDIVEAEINPLIVKAVGEGVVAVDCLMRLADEPPS